MAKKKRTKKQQDKYYLQEQKELFGGKGDLLFYTGVAITFLGLFSTAIHRLLSLTGLLGIFLMFYAVRYDWTKAQTGVGKAGNIIALIMALFITIIYFLAMLVLFTITAI